MSLDKVIVALDFSSFEEVLKFIPKIKGHFSRVKVGMELFFSDGKRVVEYLNEQEFKVFLDLKLHDIPQTVFNSLKVLNNLNLEFINVHASGGREMLMKAREAITGNTKLIGVSTLTSLSQSNIDDFCSNTRIQDYTYNLVKLSSECSLDGVVCSSSDLLFLSSFFNSSFLSLTPGIRLQSIAHDQKRVTTPKIAFNNGASFIVMGREITEARDISKSIFNISENLKND